MTSEPTIKRVIDEVTITLNRDEFENIADSSIYETVSNVFGNQHEITISGSNKSIETIEKLLKEIYKIKKDNDYES